MSGKEKRSCDHDRRHMQVPPKLSSTGKAYHLSSCTPIYLTSQPQDRDFDENQRILQPLQHYPIRQFSSTTSSTISTSAIASLMSPVSTSQSSSTVENTIGNEELERAMAHILRKNFTPKDLDTISNGDAKRYQKERSKVEKSLEAVGNRINNETVDGYPHMAL